MNSKLEAVAEKAAEILKANIREAEHEILAVWDAVVEEAQANEKPAVFPLGFSMKLNLDGNQLVTCLSFGVRRKFDTACELPDPNQPEFPGVAE